MFRLLLPLLLFILSCSHKEKLTVLSAAGLKEPVTEIVEKYKKEHPNVEIDTVFSGSGSLLVKLKAGLGDVYIPATEDYIKEAEREGLIKPKSVKILAYHEPVVIVRKGLNVKDLKDLLQKDITIGIADPKEAAIGKVTYGIFRKAGIWDELEKKAKVKTATVNQLVLYFNTGQIDAAVIWKELASKVKGGNILRIPKGLRVLEAIPAGATAFSKVQERAEDFISFAFKERKVFEKYGFITK